MEHMAQDAEDAAGRGDMRELYQITKRLAGKKSTQPQHVLSKDGETLTSPQEQLERAFSGPPEPTIAAEPSPHPPGAPNPEC